MTLLAADLAPEAADEILASRRFAAQPHFHAVVHFADDGDGTHLSMRARFPSAAARRYVVDNFKAIEGGRQTLERLEHYIDMLR